MRQATTGKWYAYVADDGILIAASLGTDDCYTMATNGYTGYLLWLPDRRSDLSYN